MPLKPGGKTDDVTDDKTDDDLSSRSAADADSQLNGPEVAPVIDVPKPNFPPGKFVHLPDRGDLLVRDFGGPPGAPTIMLLHGWTASADLNWFRCYKGLGEHYRVVAFDHRGHGSGIRSKKTFRLEDCADDAVDVATALGIDAFIPVGYSMGGPIAQLIWRRHPERTTGLVLCATAPFFSNRRPERLSFLGLAGLATLAKYTPDQTREWLTEQLYLQRRAETWEPWAIAEASSHDWRMLLEAGKAIGRFSSADWIGEVDVPTAVLITMNDPVIPLARQVKLFELVGQAEAFRVDGGHDAVVAQADQFVPTLLRALDSVNRRAIAASRAS
ncbi:MAG: 3-oxoadipate enol-lactonase [Candidatus Azotimanducaceae bacterium]|jgi:3-oxoadipate enol-lactonase